MTLKTRTRKVFGRLLVEIDSAFYWFELNKSGIVMRQFRKRKRNTVPFRRLRDWSIGQMTLPL